MKSLKCSRTDNHGVALLLTLGLLSIILVLAISFSITARTTRSAAVNTNDLTVAELLAESAVQRAIGAMRFYSAQSLQFNDIISHDESDSIAANRKNYDWLHHIETFTDSVEYDWPAAYDPDASDAVHWQYIYNGLSGSDEKIIGRVGYVTQGTMGQLDPSVCVDSGASPVNENGANEERCGKEIEEINIQNLDPSNSSGYLAATDVSNFSSTNATPAGALADGERWPDWETLFSALSISDSNWKDQYRTWFVLDNPPDPESFWIDSDSDGAQDMGEFYHRFNLARTDWDSLTVSNIINDPTVYSTSSGTHDGSGLKWLKNWTETGTFSDLTARKNQLAANLIDYNDSNDDVTTDSTSNPTYTGLEKTPYINELAIEVEGTTTMINVPGPDKEMHLDFTIRPGAEIINMYGANFSASTSLTVEGNVYFELRAESGQTNNPGPLSFSKTFSLTGTGTDPYKFTWGTQDAFYSWVVVINPPHKGYCENVKVQITKAVLTYNSKFADCAKPDGASDWSAVLPLLIERDNHGVDTVYFSWQIDDPRQNLNNADWSQASYLEDSYGGTQDAVNTGITCTTSGDAESGSTPTTISTAYIRNASMKSPWELGLLHRGEKWETLNIDAYDETDGLSGVSSSAGGGTYANGDANILNQIKMTGNVETYGKVNINGTNESILRALLAAIRVGVTMSAPGDSPGSLSSGTELDYNTDVTNMASSITGSADNPFTTRAHVVKVSKLSDGSEITQDTDAKKEEVIGKFVNLTEAGFSNTITIIAIAQAIKDVGDGVTISKDLDGDGTVGSASEVVCGYDINGDGDASDTGISETVSVCAFATYDQYADEILAEQKILAIVYRNPSTGKWTILRYEYLEN